jgi:putative restriction endonuclease
VHNARVHAWVGVTDNDWYRFLAARPERAEVNFWRPSSRSAFGAIEVGEPFFFKSRAPHNRMVGGGFFSAYVPMRLSQAWDLFGEGNGAANLEDLRALITRHPSAGLDHDPEIGCVLLRDVRFFPVDGTADPPPGFARSIQQGKRYDMSDAAVSGYFGELLQMLLGAAIELDFSQPWHRDGPVFSDPRLRPYRLGQQAFKAKVLDAYRQRCAITGSKIWPVLEAAHIRPVTRGGEHRLDNGLLLRSDVHTLFDRGYLGVDPGYRLRVSPRLRQDFGNGERFYAQAGQVVALPERKPDRPHREFLEWHLDEKFMAS